MAATPDPTAPPPFAFRPAPAELALETERLLLRPIEETDLDEMVQYRGDPEVCRYLPFEPQTAVGIRARSGHLFGSVSLEGERGGISLGVVRRADDALIGDVLLFHPDPTHGTVEIGWVMHPDAAGQGYATEACRAVLDAAFRVYGVRRVVARIAAKNTSSARLAERLGMRLEARLVENEWFKGVWGDELDYAILAREWRPSGE